MTAALSPVRQKVAEHLAVSTEHGRISALAAHGHRDLLDRAAAYPGLFSARAFEPALYANIALIMAFTSPWCSPADLRVASRAVLWAFALDWQIDHAAQGREEIEDAAARYLTVAAGGPAEPDDDMSRLLSEIRDDLAGGPGRELLPLWRTALERVLSAMQREWEWKTARRAGGSSPSLQEYLDNADNLASTFVNVTHLAHTGDRQVHQRITELVEASDEVQRVLRLVNDLSTYRRDLAWGDLNSLLLVDDRTEVEQRIQSGTSRCRALLAELEPSCPRAVEYLARQLGYSSAFYGSTDFWASDEH
ncbi:terpene synthase family protein [Micromonospora sp. H33]|uniref:terpene synthase family protein n=1 Tax=Micromonospora sp. H33 TaxID=3452215 RepID=UPI003F88D580